MVLRLYQLIGCAVRRMCQNSIDFRRGNAHPSLVLLGACPGQDEWNADPQRPFAGRSGVNLRHLLEVLRDLPNKEVYGLQAGDFLSANLDDYTLMNSHADAKWLAEHGRSMPRMPEIESDDNLLRLTNQLQFVAARFVIGLGRSVTDAPHRLQPIVRSVPSPSESVSERNSPRYSPRCCPSQDTTFGLPSSFRI